jgi:LEA14-like dessication related protein
MNLAKIDFHYSGVDCDYDYIYDCESYGCDSICRCGSIQNTSIDKVDIPTIVERIYQEYVGTNDLVTQRDNKLKSILFGTGKELDIYTIDRVVRKFKLYDEYSWDIDVCGGYYGDELNSISISSNTISSTGTNQDVIINPNGSGIVQVDAHFNLTSQTEPLTPADGVTLYVNAAGDGGTGIYFKNADGVSDELVSRNKALLYSIIF